MPPNPRSSEDKLTESLAEALGDNIMRRAFWELTAPARLHEITPQIPQTFAHLGTSKPDLIFRAGEIPLLYVEAKLGSQTEPLQLIRARSWMRSHGAADDQLVYLSHFSDIIPNAVGWPNNYLPIRAISWNDVRNSLAKVAHYASPNGRLAFATFENLLQISSPKNSVHAKHSLRSELGHSYGTVMHEFAQSQPGVVADFVYGSRISPRLAYGFRDWKNCFGETDPERLWLFYGKEGAAAENYRAQLILWHRSDFAGSESFIRNNWTQWRQAILTETLTEFEWGGRQHANRRRGTPPHDFPNSIVGLINLPLTRIAGTTAAQLTNAQLVKNLRQLVSPLERIVNQLNTA